MEIWVININEGLEKFIMELRIMIVSLLKKEFQHEWPEKFCDSLSDEQQQNWRRNIQNGRSPEDTIDIHYMKAFAIKYKTLLWRQFDKKAHNLPTWFDEIAHVRHHVSHYTTAYLTDDDVTKAWINMIAIAQILKMKDLQKNLELFRKRKNITKEEIKVVENETLPIHPTNEVIVDPKVEATRKLKSENLEDGSNAEKDGHDIFNKEFVEEVKAPVDVELVVKLPDIIKREEKEDKLLKSNKLVTESNINIQTRKDVERRKEYLEQQKKRERSLRSRKFKRNLLEFLLIIGGLASICILWYLFSWDTETSQNKPIESKTNLQQEPKQASSTMLPEVKDCEKRNTGDYRFSNNTQKTTFLSLKNDFYDRNFEVPPNKTLSVSNLTPGLYFFQYSYYKRSNFTNETSGNIRVEKCLKKTLELKPYISDLTKRETEEKIVKLDTSKKNMVRKHVEPLSTDCEKNNTGDYCFTNSMERTLDITIYKQQEGAEDHIYLFPSNLISVSFTRSVTIPAGTTKCFYGIEATNMGFFIVEDGRRFMSGKYDGLINIEKCKSKTYIIR